jgi:hypothetical protein
MYFNANLPPFVVVPPQPPRREGEASNFPPSGGLRGDNTGVGALFNNLVTMGESSIHQ